MDDQAGIEADEDVGIGEDQDGLELVLDALEVGSGRGRARQPAWRRIEEYFEQRRLEDALRDGDWEAYDE